MIAGLVAGPAPLPVAVPVMLDQLFGGDRAASYWFSHYGLGSKSAAPSVDEAAGKVAVPKQERATTQYSHLYYGSTYTNPGYGRNVKLYLLDNINEFGSAGGFAAWVDRLKRLPADVDAPDAAVGAGAGAGAGGVGGAGAGPAPASLQEMIGVSTAIVSVRTVAASAHGYPVHHVPRG